MNEISNRIYQSVINYPTKIAMISPNIILTYSEMNGYINLYMREIKRTCIRNIKEQCILIYMESPLEAIIAQLAILRSGAICIPLDRQTPLDYYKLSNIPNIACIITDDYELHEQKNYPILHIYPITKENPVTLDAIPYSEPVSPTKYTHCIMTSGTTGNPKAIFLKQDSIINQINAKIQLLNMDNKSKVCLSMELSFVASIWQIFATIFVGGSLILLDEQSRHSPYEIFKKSHENQATILCIVPTALKAYLMVINNKSRKIKFTYLLTVVITGEILHTDLINKFYQEYNIPVINAYGQTECSDDTFHYLIPQELNNEFPVVPIGYPINNIDFAIIDEFGNKVDKGNKGELCICGICLSDGYVNDEERTTKVFKTVAALNGNIAFYTGDIVSQLDNEALICHGRSDNQIKIRGYRIEPESIENCCLTYPGIFDTLVIKTESNSNSFLQLIYVTKEGYSIDIADLKDYLMQRLPRYMIPAVYTVVESINYNEHGKKIRNVGANNMTDNDKILSPKDNMQKIVEIVFHKNIGREWDSSIALDDNFVSLLNSIEFICLVVGLEEALNIEFDDDRLLFSAFPTLNDLLNYLLYKISVSRRENND